MLALISELRQGDYAGYVAPFNAARLADTRVKEMYDDIYGPGLSAPHKVRDPAVALHRAKLSTSLVHDKHATPAKPAQAMQASEATARPLSVEAQRSSAVAAMVHEDHAAVR